MPNTKIPFQADEKTLQFVSEFCAQHLKAYGLKKLYLIGSRAYGTARKGSDHDFIAVVGENSPDEISNGREMHIRIFSALDSRRKEAGLGAIDLLIARQSYFRSQETIEGTFANAAVTKGYVVI